MLNYFTEIIPPDPHQLGFNGLTGNYFSDIFILYIKPIIMENTSVLSRNPFNNDNVYETSFNREMIYEGNLSLSSTIVSLIAEGGENLFHYLKSFNLLRDSDLIVLPSNQHYYYDENDLQGVRTIVNLKRLNLIKDLDAFLSTLRRILPSNVNFIGCFSDCKSLTGFEFFFRLSVRFNSLLDPRADRDIKKKNVTALLEKHGFKVIDMTETGGLTYFYSQNIPQDLKIRA
jgi:hypothetical protein